MSQIFDALQRSEAERNGKDPATASRATELLKLSEREAAVSRPVSERSAHWTSVQAEPEPTIAVADPMVTETEPKNASAATIASELLHSSKAAATQPERQDGSHGPMECETLHIAAPAGGHLVVLSDTESAAGEAFHLLGVRIRHLRRQRALKKILVTSTIPQEGKSVVASNLACTLALRTQQKVLLLEGDVRRPTQSKIFGIAHKPGICEWLAGEKTLLQSIYRLDGPGIWIFPAGASSSNSLELLQSGRMGPMVEQLSNWFDWVIIDSPPILPLADTSMWANVADGTLLVVRQGITQKRQLQRGLEALGNQKLIGAVLNSAQTLGHTDYYYRSKDRLPTDDAEA
jgi:capsular exopolysaccharide synthesis family protein